MSRCPLLTTRPPVLTGHPPMPHCPLRHLEWLTFWAWCQDHHEACPDWNRQQEAQKEVKA